MRKILVILLAMSILTGCSNLGFLGKSEAWLAGYDFGQMLNSKSLGEANAACQFALPSVFSSTSQQDYVHFIEGCIEGAVGSRTSANPSLPNGETPGQFVSIDSSYAEEFLRTSLYNNLGIWFLTQCPPNMRGLEGARFTCFACPELNAASQIGGGYFYGDGAGEFRCDAAYEGIAIDYEVIDGQILLNNESTRRANPSAANPGDSDPLESSQDGSFGGHWASKSEGDWTYWLESVFLRSDSEGEPALELVQSTDCDGCQEVIIRLGFERMPGDNPPLRLSLYLGEERLGDESIRLGKAFYTDDADLVIPINQTSRLVKGDELKVLIRLYNFDLEASLFGVVNSYASQTAGSNDASGVEAQGPEPTPSRSVKEEWLSLVKVWMGSVTVTATSGFTEVPNIFQGCPQDMCGHFKYEISFEELSVPNCRLLSRFENLEGQLLNRHQEDWSLAILSPYVQSPAEAINYLDGVIASSSAVRIRLQVKCNTAHGILQVEKDTQEVALSIGS